VYVYDKKFQLFAEAFSRCCPREGIPGCLFLFFLEMNAFSSIFVTFFGNILNTSVSEWGMATKGYDDKW
jgi:hypothetical protein